ncbi:hypothetical protein GGS20DRAFT_558671 [Poronia punctata]|nr:hypothetical protein GGS20DRAFT_558671 [Poronia punctata]
MSARLLFSSSFFFLFGRLRVSSASSYLLSSIRSTAQLTVPWPFIALHATLFLCVLVVYVATNTRGAFFWVSLACKGAIVGMC